MLMLNNARKYLVSIGAMAVVSAGAAALPAHAQSYADRDGGYTTQLSDGVTVYARPYEDRDAATGAMTETVRSSRVVYFHDIDPNTQWGHRVLERRVEGAARDACQQLDRDYPLTDNMNDERCVDRATQRAMQDVNEMTSYDGD